MEKNLLKVFKNKVNILLGLKEDDAADSEAPSALGWKYSNTKKNWLNQILNSFEVSAKMDTSFLFICMLIENYGVSL